jgi:thiol-disulfide isomerase/thioredoxin
VAKKNRKRNRKPESPIARWVRRHPKWPRRLWITAGLVAVLAAVWFIADPLGGTPTAIDETGQEVNAGVIDGRAGARARAGSPAPNFLLPDYDRRAVRLDHYDGKAVFVNFWASWCGPCEREMPSIVRIAERFPDDVVVIAINRGESKGTAEGWTRSRSFPVDLPNFKWVLDSREYVTREYRVEGMPQSFFIDESGLVRSAVRRGMEYDEMLANIQQIVNPEARSSAGR